MKSPEQGSPPSFSEAERFYYSSEDFQRTSDEAFRRFDKDGYGFLLARGYFFLRADRRALA